MAKAHDSDPSRVVPPERANLINDVLCDPLLYSEEFKYWLLKFIKIHRAPAATSGIQFDTNPQTGGFLYATTLTGGIRFTSAEGINLISNSDVVNIQANGPGQLNLEAARGSMNINAGTISMNSETVITITANGAGNNLTMWSAGGDFIVKGKVPGIGAHQPLLIVRHDPTGVAAPTYHIKTGATWVADL